MLGFRSAGGCTALHCAHPRLVCRVTQDAAGSQALLLQLLDLLLGSISHVGAPIMISCPSTFRTLRELALQLGELHKSTPPFDTGSAVQSFCLQWQMTYLCNPVMCNSL